MEPHPDKPRRAESWGMERFKAEVVNACRREPFEAGLVAYDALPESIFVDSIGRKVSECGRETAKDGTERAATVRYNPFFKAVELQQQLFKGSEDEVNAFWVVENSMTLDNILRSLKHPTSGYTSLEQLQQDTADMEAQNKAGLLLSTAGNNLPLSRLLIENSELGRAARTLHVRRIGTIHSHPGNSLFSPVDLIGTLTRRGKLFDFLSTADGQMHALVTTTDTQWIPCKEAEAKRVQWDEMLDERYKRVRANPQYSGRSSNDLWAEVITTLTKSVAKKYKLGYYTGDFTGILDRVTLE